MGLSGFGASIFSVNESEGSIFWSCAVDPQTVAMLDIFLVHLITLVENDVSFTWDEPESIVKPIEETYEDLCVSALLFAEFNGTKDNYPSDEIHKSSMI